MTKQDNFLHDYFVEDKLSKANMDVLELKKILGQESDFINKDKVNEIIEKEIKNWLNQNLPKIVKAAVDKKIDIICSTKNE